jgi:hypothetical protein
MRDLFLKNSYRTAGVGLKIHPHGRYENLYYWLLGEASYHASPLFLEGQLVGRFPQNPYAEKSEAEAAEPETPYG